MTRDTHWHPSFTQWSRQDHDTPVVIGGTPLGYRGSGWCCHPPLELQ